MNAGHKHLASSLKLCDGSESPYYRKMEKAALDQAKEEIYALLSLFPVTRLSSK